ncbi:2'-5' RNA ligase family protein [Ginsengibacter hankyongi]|uniref:2'-5' RNA ligase family protein n=1 Tax=Ginsengibacter hankyongi TaxID=2607284 RepID=A0A5J5IHL3_9BACT|nr:2'-5' RNA ligase family protein [Ginsengibacter hankyongi]KAA9039456.1 2'-5' RNA ligase family protein [Ginsengibacter hankyongi]
MKTKNYLNDSSHECYEYLLVINPGKEVNEKLMAEKQMFYDDYKEKGAISTKPYIIVARFVAKEGMENTIIRWMQRICSKQKSFVVMLNNYGGFPPNTIYLRIQNEAPLRQLAKELSVVNAYINASSCPPMLLTPKPHVSVASNLSEEIFFKALTQYAHKSFHESFLVNELLLLKRRDGYDAPKPIIVFALPPFVEDLVN